MLGLVVLDVGFGCRVCSNVCSGEVVCNMLNMLNIHLVGISAILHPTMHSLDQDHLLLLLSEVC